MTSSSSVTLSHTRTVYSSWAAVITRQDIHFVSAFVRMFLCRSHTLSMSLITVDLVITCFWRNRLLHEVQSSINLRWFSEWKRDTRLHHWLDMLDWPFWWFCCCCSDSLLTLGCVEPTLTLIVRWMWCRNDWSHSVRSSGVRERERCWRNDGAP